jgi:peptidyl-prolyl cis-trans isomerase C
MRIWILLIAMVIMISGCEVADSTSQEVMQVEAEKLAAETVSEPEAESSVKEVVEEKVSEAIEAEPAEESSIKVETVKVEPTSEKAAEVVKEAVEQAVVAEVNPEEVVVTVNGVEITEGQVAAKVDERVKVQTARMSASGRQMPAADLDKMEMRLRPGVIDMMVEERLLRQKVEAKGVEVSEDDIDARVAEMAEQRNIALEEVEGELAKSGMTMEGLRRQIKMGLGIQKLVDLEMGAEGQISDEEAKKHYDDNVQRFSNPDQVEASHILIKTDKLDEAGKAEAKTKIEGLLVEVKGGADFAELAKEHSECPSGKSRGGDLGFFARERMVKEFSDAAFSMEEGAISDIVETKFGYHIIKVTGKKAASTTSYEEAKEGIVSNLERRKKGDFWRKYRTDLKTDAQIVWSEKEKAIREEAEKKREEARKRREEAMKKQQEAAKNKPGSPPKVTPVPPGSN